jgi:hypothetical protein
MKTPTQEIVMKTFVVRLELEIDAATPTEAYRVDAAELKKA